jgi:hypothetical protein
MDNLMNALFGTMGTTVFLSWAEVVLNLVAMGGGVLVFMAVRERARMWSGAAIRLWQEAAPEDGGPILGP